MLEAHPDPATSRYDRTILEDGQDSLAQIARRVRPGERVLDVGCSTGALGRFLSARGCRVDGIDSDANATEAARPFYEQVWSLDVEHGTLDLLPKQAYQVIVCADILEHLRDPGRLLKALRNHLAPEGRLLVSVPNIGYAGVIAGLLDGEFKYRPTGLLDEGHLRFFTRSTIVKLLREQGFEPTEIDTVRSELRETEFRGERFEALPPAVMRAIMMRPDALTYQFILTARPGIPAQSLPADDGPWTGQLQFEAQLFWDDGSGHFDEGRSCRRGVALGVSHQRVEFEIPPLEWTPTRLRLDPFDRPGFLKLHSVQLFTRGGDLSWEWNGEQSTLGKTRELIVLPEKSSASLLSTGQDPSIELAVPVKSLSLLPQGGQLVAVIESSGPDPTDDDAMARLEKVEQWLRTMAEQQAGIESSIGALKAQVPQVNGAASALADTRWRRELRNLRRDLFPAEAPLNATPNEVLRSEGKGQWLAVGPAPSFALRPVSGPLPTGWCIVEIEFEALDDLHDSEVSLSYDEGNGFSEKSRLPLEKVVAGKSRSIVLIPQSTVALRLSPIVESGRFRLGRVSLLQIGKFRAGLKLLEPRVQGAMRNPRALPQTLKNAMRALRKDGLPGVRQVLMKERDRAAIDQYRAWAAAFDTLTDEDRRLIRERIPQLPASPLISVVMPVYNAPEKWLRRAIESVREQLYPHWELCIADDASTQPHVRQVLESYAALDSRIKVTFRTANGHISEATNSALELAQGEFVALLDHDDELTEHALYMMAEEIGNHPDADLIYSDEDKVDEHGRRFGSHFKPDWNMEMLWSENYICHLSVFRTSLMRAVGGLRKGVEGSQDFDLVLRVTARSAPSRIRHIPHVLYHWRAIEGSTALDGGAKDYASEAGLRALRDYVRAEKLNAEVLPGPARGTYRVKLAPPEPRPLVSLIIPTRDGVELLRRCIGSIKALTDYGPYEIIVVDNQSSDRKALKYLKELEETGVARVLKYDKPFNYSAINNWAVSQSKGAIIGLLNNDLEVIEPSWLTEMVAHAARDGVGAVGAKLLYPNDTVQHAGVISGLGGVAGHVFLGIPRDELAYGNRARIVHELSVVTAACLVVRRDAFLSVGGLDEQIAVAFNDVDFCLKLRTAGYRNIWTPYALLYHLESATRGSDDTPLTRPRFERETAFMNARWGDTLTNDVFYNPNFSLHSLQMELAWPPRSKKPWRT